MFKQGDIIFVGTKGICLIDDIKKNAFVGCDKTKEYYILKPIETTSSIVVFLPTDTSVKIRKLISKNKAQQILQNIRNITFETTMSDIDKNLIYSKISQEVEIDNRIKVLNFLVEKKLNTSKKNFPQQDQKLINTLVDCIAHELSYVLNEPLLNIKEEINKQLEK